ncbi:TetR/AcrR family transcriptional regulator [Halobacteriovorax sp. GFR7]|uniref:TetR/AcrR family transcriptional regulator n=1 Tax=unclassified Halobacteriovorax TaxID=2639665 RepID=UPI003D9694CB
MSVGETPKGEKRKTAIIETAIDQMAQKGIDGASFQKIANTLGVSQSAVFHYFKNKSELFLGVLEYIVSKNHARVISTICEEDTSLTRLKKHCLANFQWLIDRPNEAKTILYLYYRASIDQKVSQTAANLIHTGRKRIIDLVRSAQENGQLAKDLNPELAGQAIHEFLTGAIIQILSLYNVIDPEEEVKAYTKRLETIINRLND